MPILYFTVDAALLRELGERLVGQPYIALAELVKNSYDADSTKVTIEMNPDGGSIAVIDDGHGMNLEEFRNFWMRIGSTHKAERVSRHFKRPMTGSKGVGRLAVQFIAKELYLQTVSEKSRNKKLKAQIKWEEAIQAGDLTEAKVIYEMETKNEGFNPGTTIVLKGLKDSWDEKSIEALAKEIWWLQPPFRSHLVPPDDLKAFIIEFLSPRAGLVESFNQQIKAILDIWTARLIGKNEDGKVIFSLEFAGEEPINHAYDYESWHKEKCNLKNGDFEIRIYHLQHRQPHGIKVGEARDYLNEFGGVHVYDGGFHLPYYGTPKNDWLEIDFDHSHRLSVSQLLPKDFQVEGGLMYLPTLSRILGVVNVDTSKEPNLKISVTRDRLQESKAYRNLWKIVRYAVDFYAMQETMRVYHAEELEKEIVTPKFKRVEDVLVEHRTEIPKEVFEELYQDIQKATTEIETEAEKTAKRIALFGSLATAGISSLAYQHELKRQFGILNDVIKRMDKMKVKHKYLRKKLEELKKDLSAWLERAKATNALFAYLGNPENVQTKKRYPAKEIVKEVKRQVKILMRGIPINISRVDEDLLLPMASLVEWGAIFQNVFMNAYNAMLDSKRKLVDVSSRKNGKTREVLVQDTGCGVDLSNANTLFEPFERRVKISAEKQALGYGGTGLGLTIVRLIANNLGCEVSFAEPEKGFSTAFSIKWRESE